MKFVHWLLPGEQLTPESLSCSSLASIRLRAAVAAKIQRYHFTIGDSNTLSSNFSVIVVGKYAAIKSSQYSDWLDIIKQAKTSGAKVVIDFTDNHFENIPKLDWKDKETLRQASARCENISRFYIEVVAQADMVICSTSLLANAVSKYFHKRIAIVEDAIDDLQSPSARSEQSKLATGLWFGHGSNLPYFLELLPTIGKTIRSPLRILAITNESMINNLRNGLVKLQPRTWGRIQVKFLPWSLEQLTVAASKSDFCLIPSDPDDPRKNGASSNRLITALALGLPTCADMLESYRPFKDYFVDIRSRAFPKFLNNPLDYASSVSQAQTDVVPMFRKDVIAKKWENLFDSL